MVLHEINKNFIRLPEDDVRVNNQILTSVRSSLIDIMKQKDPLFNAMYRGTFYGGSFYDGLKVGRPDEFDLDLLMGIPKYAQPVLFPSGYPGFTSVVVHKFDNWMRQPEAMPAYRNFSKLFDGNSILNSEKTLKWMQGLVEKSLVDFKNTNRAGVSRITTSQDRLHISGRGGNMDVDLVPCFVFNDDMWPRGFRPNPIPDKKTFFIVPKMPKGCVDLPHHWRLSFQEQEMALLSDKLMLKPTLRLLKKIRDRHDDSWMASYHIKTVFLYECLQRDERYWQNSLSQVFLDALKNYQYYVNQGKIPYFWDSRNNLIGQDINPDTIRNVNKRLQRIIKTLEKNSHRPEEIAKILLTTEENKIFKRRMNLDHKPLLPQKSKHSSKHSYTSTYVYPELNSVPRHSRPTHLPFLSLLLPSVFVFAVYCIKLGHTTIGCTILILETLLILKVDRVIGALSFFKFILTILVIISIPLVEKLNFVFGLFFLYVALVILEAFLILQNESFYTVHDMRSLCLFLSWVLSYAYLFPSLAGLSSEELIVLGTVFTTILLSFWHLTFDHYLIIITAFAVYNFKLVPNFNLLVTSGVALLSLKFLATVIDTALTLENAVCFMVMTCAALREANPDHALLDILAVTAAVLGCCMLLIKGATRVLGSLGVGKYVIVSMVVSCAGQSIVAIV